MLIPKSSLAAPANGGSPAILQSLAHIIETVASTINPHGYNGLADFQKRGDLGKAQVGFAEELFKA